MTANHEIWISSALLKRRAETIGRPWYRRYIWSWLQKMNTKRRKNNEGGNNNFIPKLVLVVFDTEKCWKYFLDELNRSVKNIFSTKLFKKLNEDVLRWILQVFVFLLFLRPFLLSASLFGTPYISLSKSISKTIKNKMLHKILFRFFLLQRYRFLMFFATMEKC